MKKIMLVLLLVVLLSSCGTKEVEISDNLLTNEVGSDGSYIALDSFFTNEPTIIVSGSVENVKEAFTIDVEWYYEGELIYSIEEVIEENSSKFSLNITSPYQGWPEGDYNVKIKNGDTLVEEISYQVTRETGNLHPNFLVGTYLFEQAIPSAPVNIVQQYYELRSDGTYTQYQLWTSTTSSQSTEATMNGEWEYLGGELIIYTPNRTYQYVFEIEGNSIVGVDHLWSDTTLVFSKPWMGN